MKKSRGQTLIEFVGIAILVLALIVFGMYKFGDKTADFFAGNDPGKKFNSARTVKFERPEDLLSDVSITFDGITIEPPVEKIIKASGSYIQTSGSAGRVGEMGEIIKEYVTELQKLTTTGAAGEAAFNDALTAFESAFTGTDGFLTTHSSFTSDQLLEKKLNLIKMAIELENTSIVSDVKTTSTAYVPTLMTGNRKDIISTFVDDMLGFGKYLDYFMDPSLYLEYLDEEKKIGNLSQDLALVTAMQTGLGSLTQDEKLNKAGLLKVYYSGGYSQVSPYAYNGERMCSTFGGTMISDKECEIPAP